ncbi:MAG: FAD-binding protein [Armatimonadetes bacterium]|nr:FAD-binding protein [Armatimonadota bacterium]
MMEERTALVRQKLAGMLGPENVSGEGDAILAKPGNAGELAGVLALAWNEGLDIDCRRYTVGPAAVSGLKEKVILSLERMNKIHSFDRETHSLVAEPAAAMEDIAAFATAAGLDFPGEKCRHGFATIGENIASCFRGGAPFFQCPVACLCGLDMVLLNGEAVTSGGGCVNLIGNYELTYILGDRSGEPAVIAGIHLKLLPTPEKGFVLAASLREMSVITDVILTLKPSGAALQEVVAVDASAGIPAAHYARDFFPAEKDGGTYAIFTLQGELSQMEAVIREIEAALQANKPGEFLVAAATRQKERLLLTVRSLLDDLEKNDGLMEITGQFPPPELNRQNRVYRLAAVQWQKSGESFKAYYLP